MPANMLRMIAVAAVCFCDGVYAVARNAAPRAGVRSGIGELFAVRRAQGNQARKTKCHSAPGSRPRARCRRAAPYKANRLSLPRPTEPISDIPGQTTVLTREILDDMKATSVRGALRSTAGVTVGR